MANISYPASSIIGGVSTLDYAIRTDSQATTQENCLLSPRYGLCKRPNTNFLTRIKEEDATHGSTSIQHVGKDSAWIQPLHYGTTERFLVGVGGAWTSDASGTYSSSTNENWTLYDEDGNQNVIMHFPGSDSATAPALATYLNKRDATNNIEDKRNLSFATLGGITYICAKGVTPQMSTTTWPGYSETYSVTDSGTTYTRTILNDECYAIWIKAHQLGIQEYSVTLNHNGSITKASVFTDADDNSSSRGINVTTSIENDTKIIAANLAYQICNIDQTVDADHEATSLKYTRMDATVSGAETRPGTSVITGRLFDDVDDQGNDGTNFTPDLLHSVEAESGRNSGNVTVAHKTCKTVQSLPPRSWEDHTVKITDDAEAGDDSFYMRFVNDEDTTATYVCTTSSGSFDNYAFGDSVPNFGTDNLTINKGTTKLQFTGHWEEHCGVGVKTTVDSAYMPHVLIRRADGSFVCMEARGAFQVNTVAPSTTFNTSSNLISIQVDAGFSEDGNTISTVDSDDTATKTSAFIVGDTVKFTDLGGGTFPSELKEGKEYYIIEVTKGASRGYTIKVSATEGGSAITFGSTVTTNCQVDLTTYALDKWADRLAGDDSSNPLPDIFSSGITEIFTYQNRLGFVSNNEVLFSGTNDPYNVFRTTVRDLIESDPFGVTPSDTRGDTVKAAVPFSQNLIVFTNEAQHLVRSLDGRFSAKTVEIVPASNTTCSDELHPAVVNESLFYSYETSEFGGVWEFSPSSVRNNTFVTQDISKHVPGYMPLKAGKLTGSSKHKLLFLLPQRPRFEVNGSDATDIAGGDNDHHVDYGEDQNLYVYTWLDKGDGSRVQSAWNKWAFNTDRTSVGSDFTEYPLGYRIEDIALSSDRLYLVTSTTSLNNGASAGTYSKEFYLEYMDLDLKTEDTNINTTLKSNFDSALLDRKTSSTQIGGSNISYGGGKTTITLPWKYDANMGASLEIVTEAGTRYSTTKATLTSTSPTNAAACQVVVGGVDLTSVTFQLGFGYSMISTFGPFAPSMGDKPLRGRNVFVRGARLTYTKANEYTVSVSHSGTDYTETISAGTATGVESGEKYFGICHHMPDLEYTITNETPWNALFQGVMYDLNIQEVMRSG